MTGPYKRGKDGGLERCDEDSPFPDTDKDYSVDPIEEISGDIVALMQGMSSLHRSNRFLKMLVTATFALNAYLLLKLEGVF